MITEAERFNIHHPSLCHCLHWKGLLVGVKPHPTVPPSNDGLYWCVYTQTCIGPDGELAEPIACSSPERACHGKGHV
jgi:hypothetical protein